ncbi:hypothetical protein AVEN_187602-1, partial [Araneus ventricosus]
GHDLSQYLAIDHSAKLYTHTNASHVEKEVVAHALNQQFPFF